MENETFSQKRFRVEFENRDKFLARLKEKFGEKLFTLADAKNLKLRLGNFTLRERLSALCEDGELQYSIKQGIMYYQFINKRE
jgi:hypothetical protein